MIFFLFSEIRGGLPRGFYLLKRMSATRWPRRHRDQRSRLDLCTTCSGKTPTYRSINGVIYKVQHVRQPFVSKCLGCRCNPCMVYSVVKASITKVVFDVVIISPECISRSDWSSSNCKELLVAWINSAVLRSHTDFDDVSLNFAFRCRCSKFQLQPP